MRLCVQLGVRKSDHIINYTAIVWHKNVDQMCKSLDDDVDESVECVSTWKKKSRERQRKREKVFTLFEKRAFLGKFAKPLCRLDQWQHRPLGQRKMFCLIMTAVPHRSKALAESAGLWEVGRRCMSAWTIVTSLVWERNHSHGLLNRWLLSLYLQAGAQKKSALWLDKFPISCQKSEMLTRRRAGPHGCGCNSVYFSAAAAIMLWVYFGYVATLSSWKPGMLQPTNY